MSDPIIKHLGLTDYETAWMGMKDFILSNPDHDEIWVTEHNPVYTIGLNKRDLKLPKNSTIPCVFVDRGGKITYHGPGQLIIYLLINYKNKNLGIRNLVTALEASVIHFLKTLGIKSYAKKEAPGVYVEEKKIASVGLRLKNNFIYHGLSFNIDMDLSPFKLIDPCGYKNLEMAQLADFNREYNLDDSARKILEALTSSLRAI